MGTVKLSLLTSSVIFIQALKGQEKPNVLVLTDSVMKGPFIVASKKLKKKAVIVIPNLGIGDTTSALEKLDSVLKLKPKWDVIHFNFGLSDLRYVDGKTKQIRVLSRHAGGVKLTSLEKYRKNLKALVTRLKKTNAKLIWATTIPLRGSKMDHIFKNGSELEYNKAANEIMRNNNIKINDLHAWFSENITKFKDPFAFNKKPVDKPIISYIEAAIGQ